MSKFTNFLVKVQRYTLFKVEESNFEGTDLIEKNIVTKQSLLLFQSMTGNQADLSDLKQLLMLKILDEQVVTEKITFAPAGYAAHCRSGTGARTGRSAL